MTKQLAEFILAHPFGFVTEAEMPAIIEQDRLVPLLVRCGGTRFCAGAQYIAGLLKMVEAGGDYVRDVSFPSGVIDEARAVVAGRVAPTTREVDLPAPAAVPVKVLESTRCHGLQPKGFQAEVDARKVKRVRLSDSVMFNEGDCGGAFDGTRVTSDADPGL
jgi:hypothetical protein